MRLALAAFLACFAAAAQAQGAAAPTPAGLWKTFNDRTGQAEGLVRVFAAGAGYEAKVEAVFSPPAPSASPRCELCPGDLKNRPVVGMTIAHLRADGDGWSGQILDPDEGEVYRCSVHLRDGGRKLEVRGYVGVPLFGRTETWLRQE